MKKLIPFLAIVVLISSTTYGQKKKDRYINDETPQFYADKVLIDLPDEVQLYLTKDKVASLDSYSKVVLQLANYATARNVRNVNGNRPVNHTLLCYYDQNTGEKRTKMIKAFYILIKKKGWVIGDGKGQIRKYNYEGTKNSARLVAIN